MEFGESPTIQHLETKRGVENLQGSHLKTKRSLFGKEYSFYDDGSVLIVDPRRQEYHFLTAEGRALGKKARKRAKALIQDDTSLQHMRLLGEGKGGFSKVYEMETETGSIAVKATDQAGFFLKEHMGEATSKQDNELDGVPRGKKIVQKMSLRDTVELFKQLDTLGIKQPEFYGFTVRRNSTDNQIQEFQFMEPIHRPTVQAILDKAMEIDSRGAGEFDDEELPNSKFLTEMMDKYYQGDFGKLVTDTVRSFYSFVLDTKDAVFASGDDIGDLEMDNIFLIGYDEENKRPEFMIIDPIREQVLIRSITKPERTFFKKNIL